MKIAEFYRPGQPNWEFWVWTFHPQCRNLASCHSDFTLNQCWLISKGQKLPFWKLWILFVLKIHAWKCQKYSKIQNSELLKWLKWQFLTFWNQPNLISRKIRQIEKVLNFHTVIIWYTQHSLAITGSLSHIFLAKISWK